MTKAGFFKKYEYVYDEFNDCYICPGDQVLKYSTTNREGYKEYKSCSHICEKCEFLGQCTSSKNHVKVVNRHVWEEYMEACEDIQYTEGMKELYSHRKETKEKMPQNFVLWHPLCLHSEAGALAHKGACFINLQ